MQKPNVDIKKSTYENIFVDCPYCKKELIFNRISDLQTVMPISGRDLKCEYCNKVFWVKNDRVTFAKYRWFLDDLNFLKKNKNYGLYILALCQACEMFMHQAIINKLLDKNIEYRNAEGHFYYENLVGAKAYNQIYDEFYDKKISKITKNELKDKKKYKKATFNNLRSLFLHIFKNERLNELPRLKKLKEDKREKSFDILEKTDIDIARNNTIHKDGFRPSFCDIQKYDDLIHCLNWLSLYLDIKDSLYFLNKTIKK